jgi:hypothetical protein
LMELEPMSRAMISLLLAQSMFHPVFPPMRGRRMNYIMVKITKKSREKTQLISWNFISTRP